MLKRIVFYSTFGGFVIGFFARITFNPVLEFLTPRQGCLLGAGPYRNALFMVAPQNGALFGTAGAAIAIIIWVIKKCKIADFLRPKNSN